MKTSLVTTIAIALGILPALPGEAGAATTTKTATPVAPVSTAPTIVGSEIAGFTTFVAPAAGGSGEDQLSYESIGLINHAAYQGVASLASGRTLTDKTATWTDNEFNPPPAKGVIPTYYLEVTTGPAAGTAIDIVGTNAKHHTLTLAEALPTNVGRTPGYTVRLHWTLAGLFGSTDTAGFQAGDASSADLISIYVGKGYEEYYYSDGIVQEGTNAKAVGVGWRRVGDGADDEAGSTIFPDEGLAISRQGTAPVSLLLTGVVKATPTRIPVQVGFNLVANVYQAPLVLSQCNLHTGNPATGVRSGATAASADLVEIFNGTGYETYYYQTSVRNGSGWRSSTDAKTDAGKTAIAVGSSFVIRRRGAAGFNWHVPAP